MKTSRRVVLAASLLAPMPAHAIDEKMLSQIKRLAPATSWSNAATPKAWPR